MSSALTARDVFRVYTTPRGSSVALQGLNLDISTGEVVVVLGPSGSGKSTLLRVLAGFERPSAGSVHVLGRDIGELDGRALGRHRSTNLGFLEQHYTRALDPDLVARDLVGQQLALLGASPRERRTRADELLDRVGLRDRAESPPGELSGGEQQRIAVCAAIAHSPQLILADEPTGELDRENAAVIYALLRELVRENGCTALIVSHDLAATGIADRVVHVRDGRIAAEAGADGEELIVVGKGGWIQLPEHLISRVGLERHAQALVDDGRIVLRPVGVRKPITEPLAEVDHPRPAHARASPLVRLRGVSKTYRRGAVGTPAIARLDADLYAGELTVVTGPSGSGKTSLLLLLAGLEPLSEGEIELFGIPLGSLDRDERARLRRERVAYIAQQSDLIPFLTARENVESALALRGVGRDEARRRAELALERVGLTPLGSEDAANLSAGERQRVSLARAVAAAPLLILADEPTAHLDKANASIVSSLLASVAVELGVAVVCAAHDPVVIEHAHVELPLGRAEKPVPAGAGPLHKARDGA
jgi:ABC-type lipoprotein export system ATPase subunit